MPLTRVRLSLMAAACAAVLAVVIAIRFAQPILDGDLFFHLAYARQMLDRHTLILDHTTFSWTPASNRAIYCAWASELFLYALYRYLGLGSLFVLRYLVVLSVVAMLWVFARRAGFGRSPVTAAMLLGVVLASVVGTIIKPELFSFLLFNAVVFVYFRVKLQDRRGQPAAGWLYAVPALLLVWVNAHGGFLLVAPFLVATALGETLNRLWSPGLALGRRAYGHLVGAWALCGVTLLANPYGWRYPWQLFQDYVLNQTPRPDVAWNDAHQSIWSLSGQGLHLPEYLALMVVALVVLFGLSVVLGAKGKRWDWSVLLANLVYVPLFLVYLRTTFFWPAVFAYSIWYLAATLDGSPAGPVFRRLASKRTLGAATLTLFFLIGARTVYEAWRTPNLGSWLGFGIGAVNPVMEAEYLAAHPVGPRLYNTFDSGGYLIWRLYPQYQVMTDSRSFPYLDWFDDQYRFTMGEIFDDFIRKYPADVAIIDLMKDAHCRRFLRSPDWRPLFYGPTAAIFVRTDLQPNLRLAHADPARFREVRSPSAALRAFHFAVDLADYHTAWVILDHVETSLSRRADPNELQAAEAYRDVHRALRAEQYERALSLFESATANRWVSDRDRLIETLLKAIQRLRGQGKSADVGTLVAALRKLQADQ